MKMKIIDHTINAKGRSKLLVHCCGRTSKCVEETGGHKI